MERKIYLDCSFGVIRAAIVEDGRLCEVILERSSAKKMTETIFLGRIKQIRPSVGAAFVDIGEELNAFLPIENGHTYRCGDMIIVQGAAKQATETKGLRVTTKINLAGKWLVLVPDGNGVRISKKVTNPEIRDALKSTAESFCPKGCGLIVRTASDGATIENLQNEAAQLFAQWCAIKKQAAAGLHPGVLNEQITLDLRIARDFASNDLVSVITNDRDCYTRLQLEQKSGRIPAHVQITFYPESSQLLFDVFGIQPQIDRALKKRVWLPCGGYLIVDPCEALTVIDVNSGKMMLGNDTEDTALQVNLEAVDEIAHQLRLRNISGIVVVDFIDMLKQEHRDALLDRMRNAVKADRTPVTIEGITKLGLLEITRKRISDSLLKLHATRCSYCSGDGLVLSPHEVALRALRQIKRAVLSGQRGPFIVHCAPAAANALTEMHLSLDAIVYALSVPSRHAERFDIEQIGDNAPVPNGAIAIKKD